MLAQAALAFALGSTATDVGIETFHAKVTEYLRMRQAITETLAPDRPFLDPGEMRRTRAQLRAAIQDRRAGARAGDVFTKEAAPAFRRIIAAVVAASGTDPRDLVEWFNAERLPGARPPRVNGTYDWRLGAWMWPALVRELPPLPPELEYRIVDDDLVLIDPRASLVVDMLDDALDVGEEGIRGVTDAR